MDFLLSNDIQNLSDESIWESLTPTQQAKMLEYYGNSVEFAIKYREGVSKGNQMTYFEPSDFVQMIFEIE